MLLADLLATIVEFLAKYSIYGVKSVILVGTSNIRCPVPAWIITIL
jgi:hypothetical protein